MNRLSIRTITAIFGLMVLSACLTQKPAQVVRHQSLQKSDPDFSASEDINILSPYKINVQVGDTLYGLARKHGVDLRELIDANRLRPPYRLSAGQLLKLPRPTYHVVKESDTVYDIAHGYEADVPTLVQVNAIEPPYTIYPGQKLTIPPRHKEDSLDVADSEPMQYTPQTRSSAPVNEVQQGELQVLPRPVSESTESDLTENEEVKAAAPEPVSAPQQMSSASVSSAPSPQPGRSVAQARAGDPVKFSWPVKGKVVSRFGPKKGGLYNDGINIAMPEGSDVQAAEGGTVVYAGNELRGYGNLLLIKHNNGYLSAYAHMKEMTVKKGDVVNKGQVVAKVGQTGHVTSPQLHFSIRKGRKAVNPEALL